ncbi:unnamed protein product [Amoebophrya sp. A120]|nr:unnamed protein product [Amoebophrya sp. A120]|eukprot:GSA120T00019028001.1
MARRRFRRIRCAISFGAFCLALTSSTFGPQIWHYVRHLLLLPVANANRIKWGDKTLDPCDAAMEYDLVLFKRWPLEHAFTPRQQRCIREEIVFLSNLCTRAMQVWNQLLGPAYHECMTHVKQVVCASARSSGAEERADSDTSSSISPPGDDALQRDPASTTDENIITSSRKSQCVSKEQRKCSAELLLTAAIQDGSLPQDVFTTEVFAHMAPVRLSQDCTTATHERILQQVRYDFIADYVKTNWRELERKQLARRGVEGTRLVQQESQTEDRSGENTEQLGNRPRDMHKGDNSFESYYQGLVYLRNAHVTPKDALSFWYGGWQGAMNALVNAWLLKKEFTVGELGNRIQELGEERQLSNGRTDGFALGIIDQHLANPDNWVHSAWGERHAVLCNLAKRVTAARRADIAAKAATSIEAGAGRTTGERNTVAQQRAANETSTGEPFILKIAEVGVYLGLATVKFLNECDLFHPDSPEFTKIQLHLIDPWSESAAGYNASEFYAGKRVVETALIDNDNATAFEERRSQRDQVSFATVFDRFLENLSTKLRFFTPRDIFHIQYYNQEEILAAEKERKNVMKEQNMEEQGVHQEQSSGSSASRPAYETPTSPGYQLHPTDATKRAAVPPGTPGIFIHRAKSDQAVHRIAELDLVFVDGDHTLAGVSRDLALYGNLLVHQPGGILAGHDWNLEGFESVAVAVMAFRLGLHRNARGEWFRGPVYQDSDYTWWMDVG